MEKGKRKSQASCEKPGFLGEAWLFGSGVREEVRLFGKSLTSGWGCVDLIGRIGWGT
jgi:hypothetical protein